MVISMSLDLRASISRHSLRGMQTHFQIRCPGSSSALNAHFGMPDIEACVQVRAESREIPKTDSLANFAHHVKVKVDVVVGVQDGRKELAGGIKMPQIGTGIPLANGALAILIYGPGIVGIFCVPNEHTSIGRKKAAVPRA